MFKSEIKTYLLLGEKNVIRTFQLVILGSFKKESEIGGKHISLESSHPIGKLSVLSFFFSLLFTHLYICMIISILCHGPFYLYPCLQTVGQMSVTTDAPLSKLLTPSLMQNAGQSTMVWNGKTQNTYFIFSGPMIFCFFIYLTPPSPAPPWQPPACSLYLQVCFCFVYSFVSFSLFFFYSTCK